MTLQTKNTMVYNFTEEEREILEKAEKILDAWENSITDNFHNGDRYIEQLVTSCEFPSCSVSEILGSEDLEIEMGEYA